MPSKRDQRKDNLAGTGKRKWYSDETVIFLNLCREHNIVKLMKEKRLRVKQVFSILEPFMAAKGYERDSDQLYIKWKNLKKGYDKCRKQNEVNDGNDHTIFEYYQLMDELLNISPEVIEMEPSGYETTLDHDYTDISDSEETEQLLSQVKSSEIKIEVYDNELFDGSTPGPSNNSRRRNISESSSSSECSKEIPWKKTKFDSVIEQLNAIIAQTAKKDAEEKKFMLKFLEIQERMLKEFSSSMLQGMQDILKRKKDEEEYDGDE